MEENKTENSTNKFTGLLKAAHKSYVLYILPVPFIIWLLILNVTSSKSILPLCDDFKVTKQSDALYTTDFAEDMSQVTRVDSFDVSDSMVSITLVLGQNSAYPYAGILFHTYTDTLDTARLDLSKMDYIDFDLSARGGKSEVNIYFSEYIEGYTSLEKPMSWRTFEYQLAAESEMKNYRIDLKDFKTDNWWFEQQSVPAQDIPNSSHEQVINLIFENGNYETKGVPLSISVKNIKFGRDFTTTNIISLVALIFYYLVYFFVLKFGIRKVMGPVVIPYKQLDVTSYLDEESKIIEEYVATQYTDPDLTVKKLCADTGITHAKVQTILKKQFQLTFRQYLNKIKIHEAKRLLLETDRQVTDIAYRVGYKNVTHFNRIFKETEGQSPNQFRKASREQ